MSELREQPIFERHQQLQRRSFLRGGGMAFGAWAFNHLLQGEAKAALPNAAGQGLKATIQNNLPHIAPKAKQVIFIHMVGAPSHLDLFDYKPKLQAFDRKLAPDEFIKGKRFAFLRGHPKMLGTPYDFKKHGQSGQEMSELLPHLSKHADDMCFIKSMRTTEFNHGPAQMFFHCGVNRRGNPSIGSWVNYGLGSLSENLPGYVVFVSGSLPGAGNSLWNNGYLPSVYQGVEFRSSGDPVLFLSNPKGVDRSRRRRVLDGIQNLNELKYQEIEDPEILTRMKQYEMAYRMQMSVPELMDLKGENPATVEAYGKGDFAKHCLFARRLAERGVRFVELFNQGWDTHSNQKKRLREKAREVDKPIAALLSDLKARGMLDETLVVWGAEFGRTPMLQGDEAADRCGRDHHKDAYTIWMAGGGVKGGMTFGQTDELGYDVVDKPVEVRDFHATMFHLMGMDHEKVTYRFQGLDQRLTGVEDAYVQHDILV